MYLEGGQAFIGTVKLQTNMCAVCMWEILDYVMEGQKESLECHLSSTTERYCGQSASWWRNACSAPTWWFEGYLDVASSTTYEGLADGDVIMCCRLHPKCIQLYNIHQTVCVELFVPNQTNTPVLLTFRYLVFDAYVKLSFNFNWKVLCTFVFRPFVVGYFLHTRARFLLVLLVPRKFLMFLTRSSTCLLILLIKSNPYLLILCIKSSHHPYGTHLTAGWGGKHPLVTSNTHPFPFPHVWWVII